MGLDFPEEPIGQRLTNKEFRRYVAMGHGKAILEVQRHGDQGREAIIIAACLKNTLFDYQCDECKGWYLAQLLLDTGRPEHYLEELIRRSPSIRGRRNRRQWADLLCHLAKRKVLLAGDYLKENWKSELVKGRLAFTEAYIEAFGKPAYIQFLEFAQIAWRRRRMVADGAFNLHFSANDTIGEERAKAIRNQIAEESPMFVTIADFPERYPLPRKEEPGAPKTVEERIQAGRFVHWMSATEEDRERAAELLRNGLEGRQATSALRIFSRFKFPLELEILFNYLESSDERTRSCALDALGMNSHPRVRALAFQWCDDCYMRGEAISVLRSNFEPGDEAWVEEQLRRPNDDSGWDHWSTLGALELMRAQPNANWISTLSYMLDHVGCQICRDTAAEYLHVRKALATEQVLACRLDANSSCRKWAAKIRIKASLLQS